MSIEREISEIYIILKNNGKMKNKYLFCPMKIECPY